jgi:hypothetical protein
MTKTSIHVVDEENFDEAIAPISAGNPLAAADLAIDQSHMEEYTTAEEGPAEVTCAKPPKGVFFTTFPETGKPGRTGASIFWRSCRTAIPTSSRRLSPN